MPADPASLSNYSRSSVHEAYILPVLNLTATVTSEEVRKQKKWESGLTKVVPAQWLRMLGSHALDRVNHRSLRCLTKSSVRQKLPPPREVLAAWVPSLRSALEPGARQFTRAHPLRMRSDSWLRLGLDDHGVYNAAGYLGYSSKASKA